MQPLWCSFDILNQPSLQGFNWTSKTCPLLTLLWSLLHLWLQGWCSNNIWWVGFKTCISLGSKWFYWFGPCVFPDLHSYSRNCERFSRHYSLCQLQQLLLHLKNHVTSACIIPLKGNKRGCRICSEKLGFWRTLKTEVF